MTPGRIATLSKPLSLKWQINSLVAIIVQIDFYTDDCFVNKGLITPMKQTRKLWVRKTKQDTEGHRLARAELPDPGSWRREDLLLPSVLSSVLPGEWHRVGFYVHTG